MKLKGIVSLLLCGALMLSTVTAGAATIQAPGIEEQQSYGQDSAVKSGWNLIDDLWFYYGEDGKAIKGWLQDGASWYYMDKNSGVMQTGWVKDGTAWYLMSSYGIMQTGWTQDGSAWYFLDSNGIVQTGWIYDGLWYFMGNDGAMKTGWVNDGSSWYYIDKTSGLIQTGWLYDGAWYYLEPSGVMATNKWVGDYYFTASGAMATNTWIGEYYIGVSGKWISNGYDIDIGGGQGKLVQGYFDYAGAKQIVDLVNVERAKLGLHALVINDELMKIAQLRSAETVILFDHDRPNGLSCFSLGNNMSGENIAAGYSDANAVMVGWMNSPGHKANLLSPVHRSIGVGYFIETAGQSSYRRHYTQIFGFEP